MTYAQLLTKHEIRKRKIQYRYLTDNGFKMIADSDISKLAQFIVMPFLEELSANITEILDNADEYQKTEIFDIYSNYYDGAEIDYTTLPDEIRIDIA